MEPLRRAVTRMLDASRSPASVAHLGPRPREQLAVVTCMDARIDVFAVLALELGEANVIRNAGGRVTGDAVRSLALASHALGVNTAVVMQHTGCGLAGVTNEELQNATGADFDFLPIDDHAATLRADIERLTAEPSLSRVDFAVGLIYDLDAGTVNEVVRWRRPS